MVLALCAQQADAASDPAAGPDGSGSGSVPGPVPGPVPGLVPYTAWLHGLRLRLDTGPQGADVAGGVRDFPVSIRLAASDFPFAEASGDGSDIRFSNADGTVLDYQIETWDSKDGKAQIWVRLPLIQGGDAKQWIRMHWGNPSAKSESNGAKVFGKAAGFLGVWHLGGAAARANSVGSGNDAVAKRYQGKEAKAGLLGGADSLAGGDPGGYLDIGDGYADLSAGFTYSVWVHPAALNYWAHFLDLGNGTGYESDNLVLHQVYGSQSIAFQNFTGAGKTTYLEADKALVPGRWQWLTVTASGKSFRLYLNGSLAAETESSAPVSRIERKANFLGTSNPSVGGYFNGILDEPTLAETARSPDWIRLAYANQKPDQSLVKPTLEPVCTPRFALPADMEAVEGGPVILEAAADCAVSYMWSAMDGPAPRILDPEVKTLRLDLPRVTRDTIMVLRFSALYADTIRTGEVKVRILDRIPDPEFALPVGMIWNGADSLRIAPAVSNLQAIRSSAFPDLRCFWKADTLMADTVWSGMDLMLKGPAREGTMSLELCLDNRGTVVCRKTGVRIEPGFQVLGIAGRIRNARRKAVRAWYSIEGRRLERKASGPIAFPLITFPQ
jgi:hypothetical protein